MNFVWYGLGRNNEGDSFEESIFCQIFGRKYLLRNLWKEGSFANSNQQYFACVEISFVKLRSLSHKNGILKIKLDKTTLEM